MIKLENILGKKPIEIPFCQELQKIISEIENMLSDMEKHVGYLVLAQTCKMFSSTDGVRNDMIKLADYFEQQAAQYKTNEN